MTDGTAFALVAFATPVAAFLFGALAVALHRCALRRSEALARKCGS